jgi:uncharacterized protein YecT (DUF1311 family)
MNRIHAYLASAVLALAALTAGFATPALAQNEDQDLDGNNQPMTHAESVARAKKRWQEVDAILNARYESIRKEVSQERFAELRQLQRKWLDYRNFMAKYQPSWMPESKFPLEQSADYWNSMEELTRTRLEFLRAWLGKEVEPGITGTYEDFEGGTLTLKQTAKGLEFLLEVVRGHNAHTDEISGVARLEGQQAFFADAEPSSGKLTFTIPGEHQVKKTRGATAESISPASITR